MPLNEFGKVAAAEDAFYIPVACVALVVLLKKGFSRRQGWFYLFTFSIVRLIGASLTIAVQQQRDPSIGLLTGAAILQGIGLAPLLLATHRFVSSIARYSRNSFNYSRIMRLLQVLLLVAVIMGIVGGVQSSPDNDAATISQGRKFSRVSSVLFMVALICLFGIQGLLCCDKGHIPTEHRKLLLSVSFSIPFLFIRVIYSLLNAFSSSARNRWSPSFGTWWIFLLMGVIMEYIVVVIYVTTGMLVPIDEDEDPQLRDVSYGPGRLEMGNNLSKLYGRVNRGR